eukprot:TRINITY_DN3394_c0_g3_i1.p1 TRINITY_DN3394_c0_g3~~TRINITY_DN3394_c0_g3_i1.p1  ORF type:complete len:292 (-),score=16.49 TRINITY_DN3394_c0_g3_i1:164-1039(-)
MASKKRGLGKGLEAIFNENVKEISGGASELKINEISPNRDQPRKDFDEEALNNLADSILKHGVIQPIIVVETSANEYQIIAGERRWRAARKAGLKEIPAIVKDIREEHLVDEIALIENLQRENLNPIEEALGYKNLMEKYGLTQEEVAKSVGKSRPAVTNSVRLLKLPLDVQNLVKNNKISFGHAKVLLSFENEEEIIKYSKKIEENEISVRELEKIANKSKKDRVKSKKDVKENSGRDSYFDEVEMAMMENLGRKVKIFNKNKKSGTIEIEFYNKSDLSEIIRRIVGQSY